MVRIEKTRWYSYKIGNIAKGCKQCVKGEKLVLATYYVGRIRTDGGKKSRKLFDNQQRLLGHLKKHRFRYSLGYLLKSDGVFHEKGVDVNIAVDILVAVYEDICYQIILVSSDTDLLPAIRRVKEKGKEIEYVGFSHKPSVAMVANCTSSRLLARDDLTPFLPGD